MLFGFLLALPFSVGFEHTSGTDRRVYFVSFLAAAAASVLLIAPSAYHRLMWRQRDREHLLRTANVLAIGGLTCLAVAVSAAVYVVTSALYSSGAAAGDGRRRGGSDRRLLVRPAARATRGAVAGSSIARSG